MRSNGKHFVGQQRNVNNSLPSSSTELSKKNSKIVKRLLLAMGKSVTRAIGAKRAIIT